VRITYECCLNCVALVPAAAPEIGVGSFYSISTGENTRQVEVYWQVRTSVESNIPTLVLTVVRFFIARPFI